MYLLQRFDGCLVLLGELQCGRDFGGVGHDLGVQLAAFGHQPFLVLVELFEGAGELLILHFALVPEQLSEDHLELFLQELKGLLSILATFFLRIMMNKKLSRKVSCNCEKSSYYIMLVSLSS